MSLSTTFSAILLVVLGGMVGALLVRNTMLSGPKLPLPLSIEQIQELSELSTLRVQVSEVQEVNVKGYLGAVHALVLVQGEVEIGFDLSEARFHDIDSSKRTATLRLPEPTLRRPRLDHEKTRIVAVWQTGLWRWVPGQGEVNREIINQALRRAQQRHRDGWSRQRLDNRRDVFHRFASGRVRLDIRWGVGRVRGKDQRQRLFWMVQLPRRLE